MIETVLLNYLKTQLTVPVKYEIPADKPDEFVTLEKTGSSLENHIYSSMFAVQSHSTSMYGAMVLNEAVKEAMLGAVVLDDVASVRLNSDYNYTDGDLREYRYQAVFDVTHY